VGGMIETHSADPTRVRIKHISLGQWEEISAWINAKDIKYHALGNSWIGFDTEQDAMMFLLRWA
jgi:hypothetical protein